mmetsp:Transcript_36478/g.58742  ORF Transcript_36478/g.58742 Transcript_36478/m.58742 type:complete len:97 (+) Transcript_36478:2421-2711(+)
MLLSKFLMKTLPTPDFLKDGSRWDHMILMGLPLMVSKFIVSKALSASAGCWKLTYAYPSDRLVIMSRQTRMLRTGPAVENFSNNIASVTSGCRSPT